MKGSIFMIDVLQYICMTHVIVKYMKLSEEVNFREILKNWLHMSILRILKWICYNQFYDDDINIIRTLEEILKSIDYRNILN